MASISPIRRAFGPFASKAGVIVGIVLALLAATLSPAVATPRPTVDDVMKKLTELSHKAEQLTEQYNKVTEEVKAKQTAAAQAAVTAATAKAEFRAASSELRVSLVEQYRGSRFNSTAALMNSDSGEQYVDRLAVLAAMSRHRAGVAATLEATQRTAAQAEKRADQLVEDAKNKLAELTKQKKAVTEQQAKYQTLLRTLTAEQRRQYFNGNTKPVTKWKALPAPSKKAAIAVNFALAQRGKPYVWGAAGPGSYDCSGLTMAAWGAAGVKLTHYAPTQMAQGVPVSIGQLAPGDLVFFYGGIQHVGMYIGGGMMVHAPQSGDVVKIVPLSTLMSVYQGARRYG